MTSLLELPQPFPIRAHKFDLNNVQDVTPVEGGFIQTIQRAQPFWSAYYESAPLRGDRHNEMVAFLDGLEGSSGSFLAYDPRRPMPYAYRHLPIGSTPWGNDPDVVAGSFTSSTLVFNFDSPITLTKGDYVSFIYGTGWRLFRIRETVTGNAPTVKVSPRPPDFNSSIDCRLVRACCEMKMIGKPEWDDAVDTLPTVKFKASQFIAKSV